MGGLKPVLYMYLCLSLTAPRKTKPAQIMNSEKAVAVGQSGQYQIMNHDSVYRGEAPGITVRSTSVAFFIITYSVYVLIDCWALTYLSTPHTQYNTAFVEGNSAVAIGDYAQAKSESSISIGRQSWVESTLEESVAIGAYARVHSGTRTVALGSIVNVRGDRSVAVGHNCECVSKWFCGSGKGEGGGGI